MPKVKTLKPQCSESLRRIRQLAIELTAEMNPVEESFRADKCKCRTHEEIRECEYLGTGDVEDALVAARLALKHLDDLIWSNGLG
jgi:hypothetical protein